MKVQDRTPERLGPYRVIRRLGEGGMGVVYLATDEAGDLVAIKALHPAMAGEENARRRLAREVETMHRVRSCYVAEVIGADLDGDPPYIVTRYVPGVTLDAVIAASGPLTGTALARLARGLAEALAAVHAAGVVHRDLKPGNVMIADGEPVVIDFGIAQVPETTRLTLTGMFMGTPGYLAPEVIEGKDSGTASDVHSFAATVAFAATGRPPFGTGAFETIFYRIMHGQPDLDALPAPLNAMIRRALARDPAARPSAAELALWAATLDPALLVPSPASQAGLAAPPGAVPQTFADQLAAGPSRTQPFGEPGTDDVRDLLPPVSWAPDQAAQVVPTVTAQGSRSPAPAPTPSASSAAAAPVADAKAPVGPVSPWSPLIIASVGVLCAVSIFAPLIGTAFALSVLLALRAAAITGRQLARRRADGGSRSVGSIVAVALYPLAVVRAAVVLLALLPIALLAAAIAAAVTVVVVPVHPLPRALAFAASALVAVVGFGPGSAGGRAALARFFTASAGGTSGRLAVVYVGVLAVSAWAGLTAWHQATAFWPVSNPHLELVHLPTLRGLLSDVRRSLVGVAHRIGL
jgi:serine/threonine protein kinase